MKKIRISWLFLMILMPLIPARSQDQITSGLIPALFKSDKPFSVIIKTDIQGLLDQMVEKERYQPAEIIYRDQKITNTLKTKIRVRGHFRKDTFNCDFPPLRINFKKNDIRNTIFGPQDQFRIVTHCRTNERGFVQYVIREYLVYKMYQILNPLSLNVRLCLNPFSSLQAINPH